MRILFVVLIALVFVPAWSGAPRLPLLGARAVIHSSPVALVAGQPEVTRIGQLEWLGGVSLTSPDPAFGGFSAMHVAGDRFTLLSDGGNVVRFRMGRDGRIADPQFINLPDGPGAGWEKFDRDSESLAVDPATGDHWVGFENSNQIWRYDAAFTRALGHAVPPAMQHWPENGGAESMIRLASGGFIVIGEMARWPKRRNRVALRFDGDPIATPNRGFRFGLVVPPGFAPSDATLLPDGRMLVLLRRFALPYSFTVKLMLVDSRRIAPGAMLEGTEIATFAAPYIHDNFEAVAATREGDDTILWIASDDNQSILQRSLLLKFRLIEPAPPSDAGDRGLTPTR
ncbi:esterase-like activity of phytase family protein [Hephaestia sp. GCM10023244]|nr:esterase-like activity of phytase family protein [Hephaestia sp. MAHUQ-44]